MTNCHGLICIPSLFIFLSTWFKGLVTFNYVIYKAFIIYITLLILHVITQVSTSLIKTHNTQFMCEALKHIIKLIVEFVHIFHGEPPNFSWFQFFEMNQKLEAQIHWRQGKHNNILDRQKSKITILSYLVKEFPMSMKTILAGLWWKSAFVTELSQE